VLPQFSTGELHLTSDIYTHLGIHKYSMPQAAVLVDTYNTYVLAVLDKEAVQLRTLAVHVP